MDQLSVNEIAVEVACALPSHQVVVRVVVPPGISAREVVNASRIASLFDGLDIDACALGIWGEQVADEAGVKQGDRVEIYRPLEHDPREARMRLAAAGQTMGATGD
ncbi:MAG: RnfH family protein [Pseudomonadota bacterium]